MARQKVETKSFDEMTKSELLALCKQFGLKVSTRAKRDEIIKMLKTGSAGPEAAHSASDAPANGPALTGKQKGKLKGLRIREEELERAKKNYDKKDEPDDAALYARDRLVPKVYRDKRSFMASVAESTGITEETPEEIRLLAQSQDNASFTLTGTIEGTSSTEHIEDKYGKEVAFVYVIVDFRGIELRIPSYNFWDDADDTEKYPPQQLYSMIQHRLGAPVDFNLTDVRTSEEDGKPRYYGTRLSAMKRKRCDYWYGKYPDGTWCVNDGDIVEARIVEVDTRHVIVELGGVETKIWISEITKRFIDNVENDTPLFPGSTVKVKLSGIKREKLPHIADDFNYPVEFTASIKDAEEDPQIKYYHLFNYGDTRRAYVKKIVTEIEGNDDGNAYYCVISNKPVTVRCVLSDMLIQTRRIPKEGQEIRLRITKKNPDKYWLYGEIIRVIKPNDKNDIAFTV